MKAVVFTPLAAEDIEGIWNYTLTVWGMKQAVKYTQDLRDSCDDIAMTDMAVSNRIGGNNLSRAVNIRAGYFKYPCGEHFIYFKETEREVMVIRILHKRMDVARHL